MDNTGKADRSIHRGIQKLINGNVGALDLLQTQALAKEGL